MWTVSPCCLASIKCGQWGAPQEFRKRGRVHRPAVSLQPKCPNRSSGMVAAPHREQPRAPHHPCGFQTHCPHLCKPCSKDLNLSMPSVSCRDLTDKDGFIDEMTFEQRSEGDDGTSHGDVWEEVFSGTASVKAGDRTGLGVLVAGVERVRGE